MKTDIIRSYIFPLACLSFWSCSSSTKSNDPAAKATYLDTTFGTGGKVTFDMNSLQDQIYDLQIQSDGKIVVVAKSFDAVSASQGFALARFNADGTVDTGFGVGGKTISTTITLGQSFATKVLSSGKIMAVGSANVTSNGKDFAVARYDSSGALDTAFQSGFVTTQIIGTASTDIAYTIDYIPTTSSTIVGGTTDFFGTATFALTKYDTNGALESGFGTGGIVSTAMGAGSAKIYKIAVIDGKTTAVGEASNGTNKDFAIARYNSDGSLDTTFDADGKLLVDIGSTDNTAMALDVGADGKLTIAGLSLKSEGKYDVSLVRLTATGALDTTFGTNGKTTTSLLGTTLPAGITQPTLKMAIKSDGTIFVTAPATESVGANFGLLKFTAAGNLDTTFATNGAFMLEWAPGTNHTSSSYAIGIDANGKIVLGGYFALDGKSDCALARFSF